MSYLPSFDRQLVGRVRKYMSDHRTVMVDQMAEDLQQIYKHDYGRRKRNAFRKLVKQIHSSISAETKNKKLTEIEKRHLSKRRKEDSADDGSSDSLDELLVEYHDQNSINSSIMSMYKKQRKSNSTPSSPFRYYDSPDPSSKSKMPSKIEISKNDDDMCMKSEKFYFEDRTGDASIKESETSPKSVPVNGELDTPQNFDFIKKDYSKPKRSKKKKTVTETKDVEITGEKAKPKFSFLSSSVTFSDVGGNEKTLKEVCNLLIHMKHPEIYQTLGVVPPCGILLHGPPGCGKSLLANAIAGELSLPMLKIAATEIVSGVSGDSEQKLREVFEMAQSTTPCIVFIDEIDAITPKREIASKDMERRIVAQLIACLDDLNTSPCQILVIGATNRPDSIDPALRRAGRFDREVCMGIPDEKARVDILKVLCRKLKLETDFNYQMLARLTPGYVGADLMALCREAAMCAVNRILVRYHKESSQNGSTSEMGTKTDTIGDMNNNVFDSKKLSLSMEEMVVWLHQTASLTEEQLSELCFNFSDFEKALLYVQPSAKREGFATVPDVTWDDVGALEDVREELTVAILAPVRNPEAFAALGLTKPPGILLAGPPGCGKTLLAKAIANESGINFISVKGPELLNMYVGESERAVRQCFERARNSAPCVVFFDELDSLCPRRSGAESASTARVVNQMLTEMDGLETRGHVFVMAATNRPDIIDPAVLRPGRLDKTLYVSMPKAVDRLKILTTITRNGARPPLSDNVSLKQIADDTRCDRFTGADLSSLVREASVNALKEHISSEHIFQDDGLKILNVKVRMEHFETAFKKVKPSVSSKDEIKYEKMRIDLQT